MGKHLYKISLLLIAFAVPTVLGGYRTNIQNRYAVQTTYQDKVNLTVKEMSLTQSTTKKNIPVFQKVSETVYAKANVNIRSSYSTSENNVVSVLKKGKSIQRIGVNKEWSKVLNQDKTCYIKSEYLSLKNPAASEELMISNLKIASKINQLVCVIGNGGSDAEVSFYIKDDKGKWHRQFNIDGDVGYQGITYHKKDGDKKTPAGLYTFSVAFGINPDPGAKLSYRQITKYDYWVDDMESPYYNTWVNSKETPGRYSSEHLIDHNPSYDYAMNINSNPDNIPGSGSAIFLHCKSGSGRTAGCVAISEKYMKTLVKTLDSTARILIVPSSKYLEKY